MALYGPGTSRWSMTERGRRQLERSQTHFSVGPSALAWDGACLTVNVDEIAVPFPRRLRGTVKVWPKALASRGFDLDGAGHHRWMPLAPVSHVEVDFAAPSWRWSGHGYVDSNGGTEPVAAAFRSWDWSRADLGDSAALLYDTLERDGTRRSIAVAYDASGRDRDFPAPPRHALGRTLWGVARSTQAEPGGTVAVIRTLEDTPFYARSVLGTRLLGRDVVAMHETLSVTRFDTTLVRLMLPWRMPRKVW